MKNVISKKCEHEECDTAVSNKHYHGYCVAYVRDHFPEIKIRQSIGERRLEEEAKCLVEEGLLQLYKPQCQIKCEGRTLKLDLYGEIGEMELCVEADGPQHFTWEGNLPYTEPRYDPDQANAKFEDQKYRDRIKDRHVIEKGASLLRVSYMEYHTIRQLFREFVMEITQSGKPVVVNSNPELYYSVGV